MEYIQQLLDLHAKTTPGNWHALGPHSSVISDTDHPHEDDHKDPLGVAAYGGVMICESVRPDNRDFIAASHDAVPKLVHVIGILRSMLDSQMTETLVTKIIEDALNDAR